MVQNRYRRGLIDNTPFIKKDKKDIMLVQVYVDDIIFGSTKKSWCDEFEALTKNMFQMSSMGELTFFLGLQVKQKEDGIFISQDKYVVEILKKFDFLSVKTASTLIETKKPLVKDEEATDVDVHLYRSMIDSLMYLTASRPDIIYLKDQTKLGLWYPKESAFDLEAYSDSDYAGANLDMKSTIGGCQFLDRRLISWQCKMQTIVATSTTKAEYAAAVASYWGFIDKFVRDPNKTPDSSQRPPQDCPKCGNPVDGLYCRHCALLRKKLNEVWFTICDEHKFFQEFLNNSESSNDDSDVVSMPQELIVFNQDPGENSSQSPPHIDHRCCYGCGDSLDAWLQQQNDQVVNLDSYSPKPLQCRKIPICYDDDDDEESSTPLRDIIISELPLKDEFIKSSVENLVPNPSESEDERECDVPVCDDFTTFSNLLCDAEDDFSSSNDKSFFDEDISKEIYSNPLFDEEIISIKIDLHHFSAESDLIESLLNQYSLIISSFKIDSLLDECVSKLIFLKSIPPGIDEADCDPEEEIRLIKKLLYDNLSPHPPEEFDFENSDAVIESFSPSPILVEDNSEGDNVFPERLLRDDPIPLSDIRDFSNVVQVFLPLFTYPVTSSILLSSGSEDIFFYPDISDYHFSSFMSGVSSGNFMKFNVYPNHLNESLMEILSSTCSPMDQ
nr:uncharacterized mitochondrial protein AtMg00810-like [Tanacetum cinerariifolium]